MALKEIGQAQYVAGPSKTFRSEGSGYWKWSSGELVPTTNGGGHIEQIPGAKALVFVNRDNGKVYVQED
jgi:hypothetical protein